MEDRSPSNLRAEIARRMIVQGELAKAVGVTRTYLCDVLREKKAMSNALSIRLAHAIKNWKDEE